MSLNKKKKVGAPKAPYTSTHVRVPEPAKEQIEELVEWYRVLLRRGVSPENLPNLIGLTEWAEISQEAFLKVLKLIDEENKHKAEVLKAGSNAMTQSSYAYYMTSSAYKKNMRTLEEIKDSLEKVNKKFPDREQENTLPILPPRPIDWDS
jgi:hypothetical protein